MHPMHVDYHYPIARFFYFTSNLLSDHGACTLYSLGMYTFLTGTVHLLDFSEKTSKGLELWLPSEWVPKPELTPSDIARDIQLCN